jgi:UDP-N-acetylglucosamine 2-epimerase (non-hydrolysing)
MPKVSIVLGTRPEIIKLSPIIRLSNKRNTDVIFSGQHYDYNLGLRFIDELDLPAPDFKMKITRENPAKQLGEMIQKLSKIFLETKPDTVVVQGDTNTVLAGAFAALKSKIPVSHVESGLRSFDWRMPEEHNRIATDHISELLFAPTNTSKNNLKMERVHGKIFVVGNTIIDAVNQNIKIAEKKSTIKSSEDFILLTLHRAENVDSKNILGNILGAIIESGEKILFPIHPRTLRKIHEFGYYNKLKNAQNIKLIKAVGYFDMLLLMKKTRFILSDSGGIQEEATSSSIRKKVLILRKSTDRPETVQYGWSELVGFNRNHILNSIKKNSKNEPKLSCKLTPYGNGHSAEKILRIINNYF